MQPPIYHRFVEYGTNFIAHDKTSRSREDNGWDSDKANRQRLHRNEIAVDVGDVCWGFNNELRRVIDHHFTQANDRTQVSDGLPSAAAAVMHLSSTIVDWARTKKREPCVWVVTHTDVDFDALCSAYLARELITMGFKDEPDPSKALAECGIQPGNTQELNNTGRRIDWFDPEAPPDRLDPFEHRLWWMILLAAVSSNADRRKPMPCPRNRRLQFVLEAARRRRRNFETCDGAVWFFDIVRNQMDALKLNPLTDSVCDEIVELGPELRLLDESDLAYERDLRRARKAIVTVPRTDDFHSYWNTVAAKPLRTSDGSVDPIHTDPYGKHTAFHSHKHSHVDGLYLRDPECLLFETYAREDRANSSQGNGFLFTAIARSHRRRNEINHSDYVFSLDPEIADGRHLYPVWAALQNAEVTRLESSDMTTVRDELRVREDSVSNAFGNAPTTEDPAFETDDFTICRPGFRRRACGSLELFADTWWVGVNYKGTTVPVSSAGTRICARGTAGDLSDDEVAKIVSVELEERPLYRDGTLDIADYSADKGVPSEVPTKTWPPPGTAPPTLSEGSYRLGFVAIPDGVDPLARGLATHIGARIWPLLNPKRPSGVPTDFESRHLVATQNAVAVWSRRGVFVAHHASFESNKVEIKAQFAIMAEIASKLRNAPAVRRVDDDVEAWSKLQAKATGLEWSLAQPEGRLLSRFFEAVRFGDLLNAVHREQRATEGARNLDEIVSVQKKVEWVEIFLVTIYATELAHVLADQWVGKPHWLEVLYICLATVGTLGVAVWVLKLDKKDKKEPSDASRGKLLIPLGIILFFGALLAFWPGGQPH